MEQSVMTTQEVANQYYELAQQCKWMEIQDRFYSKDAIKREPEHAASRGIPTLTEGLDAIQAQSKARREMIETIHGENCSEPVVGGNFFSVSMGRDVTFKGMPRMNLQEIGVFGVKDGKIISEQFFY